jgi:hypothetical protein
MAKIMTRAQHAQPRPVTLRKFTVLSDAHIARTVYR